MNITDEEVEKLAELARIDLDGDKRKSLREDLADILQLAESIQELDTEDVEPTYHVLPLDNVYEDDEPRPSLDPQAMLEEAPDSSDGYFVVPRVIEES